MESSETPLDVLSRAASLVGKSDEDCREPFHHSMDNRNSPSKELPTKMLKQKRNKDRRDTDYNSKYRNKKCAGTQTGDDVDGIAVIKLECGNDCHHPSGSMVSVHTNMSQIQQRPSVITCASSINHTSKHNNNNHLSHNLYNNNNAEIRHGHRREVLSGMCDPVIEEHFRRSLGKDYPEFLSSSSSANTVPVTVDDHFAKALGETWLQLQAKESRRKKERASSSSPVLQNQSMMST